MPRYLAPLRDFLRRESAGAILLLVAALTGMFIANSPWSDRYFSILNYQLSLGSGPLYLNLTILKVINYLLMTLFFFVVGLEIKRELTSGHLASRRQAIAPFLGAIGGMAIPALIYLAIAGNTDSRGWAVPVATDIALAVGLIGLLGSRVIAPLRVFLLGLAVIDDIGAILIIAFIYSDGVALNWLALSGGAVLLVVGVKRISSNRLFLYLPIGAVLWYGLYRSGVHPTLAGVVMGLLMPNAAKENVTEVDVVDGTVSVIEWLESKLHPWSAFLVVPLFAFANTGVAINSAMISEALRSPIAWGIFFGLVFGKPLGILLALLLSRSSRISDFPQGSKSLDIVATGSAAGIGFTVAIFIANLAFVDPTLQDVAILAVIAASLVSGVLSSGLFVLNSQGRKKPRHH